jgi:ELWxxDGT repeat protein
MKKIYLLQVLLFAFVLSYGQVNQVIDINSGTASSNPRNLFVHNGNIYFSADDSSGSNSGGADLGAELWITDGTAAGTSLVKDIRTGSSGSNPFSFFEYNGNLYFTANDGTTADLWTTDGTDAGTVKIDLYPGVSEAVQRPIEVNGLMYMTGISTTGDTNDLIVWDGTTASNANTSTLDESVLSEMVEFNGKLLMYAGYEADEATAGNELYEFDPVTGTFTLIKDIDPGSDSSSVSNLIVLGSKVYFEAENDLWETDGTNAGTVMVSAASNAAVSNVNNFYAWNGDLYFEGDDGNGDQLWKYDPVADTVTNLSNISGTNNNHDPDDFVPYNGWLYYSGEDANDTDGNLFRTDGTVIEQLDNTVKDVDDMVLFNGILYFEGEDEVLDTGNELFSFDPATLSISQVVLKQHITLFPNPSTNVINVDHQLNKTLDYSILDVTGRLVKEGNLTNNQIHHNLKQGLYILKLVADNEVVSTQKIIVK